MNRSQSRLSRIKGLSYVPGGPVKKTRCAAAETTTLRRRAVFPGFPVDVLERIVSLLVDAKAAGSVMMLSMVDRALRSAIADNVGAWHKLYMHWRGPLTYQSRAGGVGNLFVSRTIPRTLPNFRVKHISVTRRVDIHRALQRADRGISSEDTGEYRAQTLRTYKRITVLHHSPCCGMCGTKRHATTPFWSLGMRLCKFCLQENLVSNHVLWERYWVDMWSPDFVNSVAERVFFFKEFGSARQRSEFSSDGLDFHQNFRTKAASLVWFFWRPHLESLMDLPKRREEAVLKHQASHVVRAWVRRAMVLRVLASSKDKKKATRNVEWSLRPDKRVGLARLRLISVLDRTSKDPPIDLTLSRRMVRSEDRCSYLHVARLPADSAQLPVQNLMGERCWPVPAV